MLPGADYDRISMPLLHAENLEFAYATRPVIRGLSLSVCAGEILGIVGPNGSGKSTLLRLLLGLLTPNSGAIQIGGDDIRKLSRRQIAQRISLVPQSASMAFGFPVREIVRMGRTPFLNRLQPLAQDDIDLVERALGETDTLDLADRPITELSGGERQRVLLARALAQNTPILTLDEPTANLDLYHVFQFFDLVRRRVDQGTAAIAVVHDLDLAARISDRVLILRGGQAIITAPPAEAFTSARIADVFRVHSRIETDTASGRPRITVLGAE